MRIGYVVETPVWKTSYRLLLDDKGEHDQAAGLGHRRESNGERLERRVAVAGQRAADVVHDGSLSAALRDAADVVPEMFGGLRPQVYDGGIGDARRETVELPMRTADRARAARTAYRSR